MQSIRLIKRGTSDDTNGLSTIETQKTVAQREREMANTVKGWIAEWEARNRVVQAAALSLIRSIQSGTESSTQPFAA